ncbi:MAG: TIGR03663 family protein [Candidatus Hydrogenedentes bacterium]|nr:TIGR03663 family protein [Candidatus Hydrogenedentota bacterium]
MPNRWTTLAYAAAAILVFVGAAALRCYGLDARPVHGDEANQAVKAGRLYDKGHYAYDPHEHHGPTLYYATLAPLYLSGAAGFAHSTISAYRLVPVVFSLVTLGLLLLLIPALGRGAVLWGMALTALSPALIFYSRYYIQESMLVCFALGAIVCGERYFATRRPIWAAGLGGCLGLMHATKETCVVLFAALALALVLTRLRCGWPDRKAHGLMATMPWPHAALAVGVAALVSVTLFSSFFTHLRGPLDSVLTYFTYAERSEGIGSTASHDRPWYYYLALLGYTHREAGPVWSELFGLAAGALGLLLALRPNPARTEPHSREHAFVHFLALYTVLSAAAFAIISYKTPWNLLPFYQPLLLIGGYGIHRLVSASRHNAIRAAACLAAIAGLAHLAWQYSPTNFTYAADVRNPYVYAHTSSALVNLIELVEDTAAANGGADQTPIYVLQPDGDYWPLPWYLRAFPQVGYWQEPPSTYEVPIFIADPALRGLLHEKLGDRYVVQTRSLRPAVLRDVYIRQDCWDRLLESRSTP